MTETVKTSLNDLKGIPYIYQHMMEKSSNVQNDEIEYNKSTICATIGKLPQEHLEIVFLLMIFHAHLNQDVKTIEDIPYLGKPMSSGKGIIYKMEQVPINLQKILYVYLNEISA